MLNYAYSLLAVVLLCAFWAVFQLWLERRDPDTAARAQKCGGCGRRGECESAAGGAEPGAKRSAGESSAIAG
jgi:hypothetical protein